MMSKVSIILTSHAKPTLFEALLSIERQTRRDFRVVVMDSGKHDPIEHEWLDWQTTGEGDDLIGHTCPVSYATNLAIRRGLVTGDYVCHFYDDDVYYPTFIERMAGFLDEHPEENAVWCSQDRVALMASGETQHRGRIEATHVLTPGMLDCRVDGGQVMYRREMLDLIGDPWMNENPGTCSHSDGLFLERLAEVAGSIAPLPQTLLAHRFTPFSTYTRS